MPNDLKTQRNLLNSRPESRSESRSESQRQKLASSGFTASIWTLSGVVLVACSNVEDFLGIDDGGGGGGRSVHVQNSPVQGARLYFDADGDGTVSMDERAAQDAQHPQGFVTNENGEATGIPADLHGKAFVAVLDGAFDADTGTEFPANTEYQSIPNAAGDHLLASPITDYVANQLAAGLTPEELSDIMQVIEATADEVAELLGLDPTTTLTDGQVQMRDAELRAILDHANYQGGDARIDALARYLAENANPMEADVEAEAAKFLGENPTATFTAAPSDPTVTIGAHDEYVTTIEVESPTGAVTYSIESADSGAFTINERGVISVVTTPTADTTLNVMVTNSDGASEMVSVEITVATAPELTAPTDTTGMVVENVVGDGTALISGIMPATGTTVTATDFVIRAPGGLSDKFVVVAGAGDTFDLALATGESLDYEAFSDSNGEFNVEVWAVEGGVRSNALTLTVTVEDANDAPVFTTTGQDLIAEIPETQTAANGTILTVEAVDADRDSVTYSVSGGTGMGMFVIDPRTGAIRVADGMNFDYDTDPDTSYTLTITATGLDANGDPDATTPDTATVTINVMDANDNAPMVTADDDTIRSVMAADNTDTAGTDTGYSITITDADAEATNDFRVTTNDPRFSFERMGMTDTWNLVLLTNQAVSAGPLSLDYRVTDGANTDSGTIMLTVVDTPVAFMSPAAAARMATENDANWELQITATSLGSNSDGMDSAIASYDILEVRDASGAPVTNNGVFSISSTGLISISGALDYEMSASYAIDIEATDTPESGVSGHDEADTGTTTITVNVQNLEEGEATYEIALTDSNDQTVTDLAVGVTLTPMVATDGADPDGIDRVVSYLWSRSDGSSLNGDATGATYTLTAGDSTTATYSVTITYIDGTDKTEVVEASTSSVSWDVVPSYDPVANPLTDGEAPMANDPVIPMTAISASGGDGKIEYSIEDPSGVFQIHPNSGALSVSENGPAMWDFETTPSYEIYIVATDVDDGSTMGTQDTARQRVVITVQDANDAPVVEGVQVTANDPLAMAGISTLAGATTGDDTDLTGTADAEYIYGDAGADTITGGGGADHIIGGTGNDGITLSEAVGSVETIYYRFSSGSGAFGTDDGFDTITNFRRGEDKIVFIDTDSSVITLTDLLSETNRGSGGNVIVNALFSMDGTTLTGVQIGFGANFALKISYAEDDHVVVREVNDGDWLDAGDPYVGVTNGMSDISEFDDLADNNLLPNYFGGAGNTNLQITGDDITASLGADIFISEKRNAEDGFFATVSATDPDGTDPIMRYDISGGTGSALFTVDVMGRISVSDGVNVEGGSATLDYDTTSEYTLEITATDGGGATSDPTTITIGLIEDHFSEYSIGLSSTTLTANLDAPDTDGVDMASIEYQWFTTTDGGTTKDTIATTGMNSIADTTSKTLDISSHTLPTNAFYGVTITYDDNAGNEETSEAYASSLVAFPFETRTSGISVGFSGNFPAVTADFTATAIGGGTVAYSTGGTDGNLFEIREASGEQHLYFKTAPTLTAGDTLELTVIATEDGRMTTDTVDVTITVAASSPAIIPDRQAFAHQDPYEPNDDQNDQTNQDNPQTPPDIM